MPDSHSSAAPARPLAYILDDEPQVPATAGNMLAPIGFAPQQFATPMAMFAALGKASSELVVLDLALGQSDALSGVDARGIIVDVNVAWTRFARATRLRT
jgi:FixJ family two-component response regulator